jgi:hypothetical protein
MQPKIEPMQQFQGASSMHSAFVGTKVKLIPSILDALLRYGTETRFITFINELLDLFLGASLGFAVRFICFISWDVAISTYLLDALGAGRKVTTMMIMLN